MKKEIITILDTFLTNQGAVSIAIEGFIDNYDAKMLELESAIIIDEVNAIVW